MALGWCIKSYSPVVRCSLCLSPFVFSCGSRSACCQPSRGKKNHKSCLIWCTNKLKMVALIIFSHVSITPFLSFCDRHTSLRRDFHVSPAYSNIIHGGGGCRSKLLTFTDFLYMCLTGGIKKNGKFQKATSLNATGEWLQQVLGLCLGSLKQPAICRQHSAVDVDLKPVHCMQTTLKCNQTSTRTVLRLWKYLSDKQQYPDKQRQLVLNLLIGKRKHSVHQDDLIW